ncbi:hypothetical protein AMAG_08575 [Allomyces macrogynus ATCC 38327]|uniref:UBX domain-containing protein n=1 Tax=Allomyces macrogynus (strain ATCC 38327) TaxID=578462 RepID=A0A0L0SM19_ALLM3|nr:hypothetical protein AMAG_08575 [Allomyces macrogynus ATCC 38327]|eukprot:KNE63449.1 hypothetical protein AMAG_08575 [Allomyces macrogynus ATCC 38327]
MTDPSGTAQPAATDVTPPAPAAADDGTIAEGEATANSLRCDDCGKLFRDIDYAQLHGTKTGHANFSESTEIIKPLTPEEKAAKLAALQAKMAERREQKRLQEIAEVKERERIRRRAGQELVQVQEALREKEMSQIAEQKRREKQEDKAAKARILAQIEQDRRDRAARFAPRNAAPAAPAPAPATRAVTPPQSASSATSARLQIRGAAAAPITHTFEADAPLRDVYAWLQTEHGVAGGKLTMTFPRRVLGDTEMGKSLRELDLVPSAALMYQK